MKKTFQLTHPKIKRPRLIEAIKNEVKKYIKRERRRDLPTDYDFWDFDCRFGHTAEVAEPIHISEINQHISQAEHEAIDSFYLEVIAVAKARRFIPRDDDDMGDDIGCNESDHENEHDGYDEDFDDFDDDTDNETSH